MTAEVQETTTQEMEQQSLSVETGKNSDESTKVDENASEEAVQIEKPVTDGSTIESVETIEQNGHVEETVVEETSKIAEETVVDYNCNGNSENLELMDIDNQNSNELQTNEVKMDVEDGVHKVEEFTTIDTTMTMTTEIRQVVEEALPAGTPDSAAEEAEMGDTPSPAKHDVKVDFADVDEISNIEVVTETNAVEDPNDMEEVMTAGAAKLQGEFTSFEEFTRIDKTPIAMMSSNSADTEHFTKINYPNRGKLCFIITLCLCVVSAMQYTTKN